jgi:hypothetical protein
VRHLRPGFESHGPTIVRALDRFLQGLRPTYVLFNTRLNAQTADVCSRIAHEAALQALGRPEATSSKSLPL